MRPTINLVRAVGTEFARRTLRPFIITGLIAGVVLISIGVWLTTLNSWWWLLEAILVFITVLFIVSVITVRIILHIVSTVLSNQQKTGVGNFVDKLQRVAENIKTPYPVIILYIIRDVVRPRPDSFIETISRDSKTLAPDLANLRTLFT